MHFFLALEFFNEETSMTENTIFNVYYNWVYLLNNSFHIILLFDLHLNVSLHYSIIHLYTIKQTILILNNTQKIEN